MQSLGFIGAANVAILIIQSLSQIGGLLPMPISTETGIIQYLVFTTDEF
jgi:hypothetical protein